jgi:hypothetical protein
MNKKLMKATFIAAIAMMTGVNVFNAQKSEQLSDIVLANVEALADKSEIDNGGSGNKIYCCGNYGTCMVVYDAKFEQYEVGGLKFSTPCPN